MTTDALLSVPSGRRTAGGSEFAELRRRVEYAGLLDRRPAYYGLRFALVGLAFVAGWVGFVMIGSSWWTLVAAVWLAVVFAQLALLAHDIAHRQVFRTRGPSEVAGRLVGNLGVGMSYG